VQHKRRADYLAILTSPQSVRCTIGAVSGVGAVPARDRRRPPRGQKRRRPGLADALSWRSNPMGTKRNEGNYFTIREQAQSPPLAPAPKRSVGLVGDRKGPTPPGEKLPPQPKRRRDYTAERLGAGFAFPYLRSFTFIRSFTLKSDYSITGPFRRIAAGPQRPIPLWAQTCQKCGQEITAI
jgi:hypothetical protein